jgi:flavin-dependent dehydrogenase
VIADGVMIIGDAAGLAYTQSGEGIRPAIESGLMAAANVLSVNCDYRRERLSQYETDLRSRFGDRGEAPALSMLPAKLRLGLARALMQTQWFARNVVLDRWFLHAQLPALSV